MYQLKKEILQEYGYKRYEISNYAKQGFACRHNCVYWTRGNYVGFGLGASSMVDNVRWKNEENMRDYLSEDTQNHKKEIESLTKQDCMEEFMFLGLRLMQGISKKSFYDCFHIDVEVIYKAVIEKWMAQKMLVQEGDRIRLTDEGIDISNVIFSDFLS